MGHLAMRRSSHRRQNTKWIKCISVVLLSYLTLIVICDARLFANVPEQEQRGGVLFGAGGGGIGAGAGVGPNGGRPERVRGGPLGVGQPPQSLLGRFHPDEPEKKDDPRNPPKDARMRLGPILFDPEHLVYDDNDDYSEEDSESEPETERPKMGFDVLSFFVPVTNFFSVLWKLFCNFILKLEKRLNKFMGRDFQDGQMSVLFVVSIAWIIFGIIVVIINHLVNRLIRDPDDDLIGNENDGTKFLRIPTILPTVETTPPTPTASPSEIDGVEAKRRRTESPRHFSKHRAEPPAAASEPVPCPSHEPRKRSLTSTWLSGVGLSRLTESRILRRRERDRVKSLAGQSSIFGSFQRRICSEDVSSQTMDHVDEFLHSICRDKFSREKLISNWLDATNKRISESVEKVSLKHFTFSELTKANLSMSENGKNVIVTFDLTIGFSLELRLCTPFECNKVEAEMVIDNLTTQIVVEAPKEMFTERKGVIHIKQSGFADVKLHWEGVQPGNESLVDMAEEVAIDAIRNTELDVAVEDLLYNEPEDDADNQDSPDLLETFLLRVSNLEMFRNINNNKTSTNPAKPTEAWRPYVLLEVDRPRRTFKTDPTDAIVPTDSCDVVWKQCQFKIPILRGVTQELLIEVWNAPISVEGEEKSSDPTFIGMCLFAVNDLVSTTPSQTRIISLQKRPFEEENDSFSQSLMTILFRFSPDNQNLSQSMPSLFRGVHKIAETRKSTAPGGQMVRTANTTYLIASSNRERARVRNSPAKRNDLNEVGAQEPSAVDEDSVLHHVHRINGVAQAALNDLQILRSHGNQGTIVERTTLFIRSVQKIEEPSEESSATNGHEENHDPGGTPPQDNKGNEEVVESNQLQQSSELTKEIVIQGTKPKKGILSSLKKKFYTVGKSPKREKKPAKNNIEPKRPAIILEEDENDSVSSCSDCSSEQSFEITDWRGKLSLSWESISSEPGSGIALLAPGTAGTNIAEDASSLSDISGVSVSSVMCKSGGAFEEASSSNSESMVGGQAMAAPSALVLETIEQGFKRHYLMPQQLAKRGAAKLKRKGRKLHLCMDHVFVARHIKGGPSCSVCRRRIVVRLGKQGYICRGCNLVCHKSCHEKVEHTCSHSTIDTMEL